jgi:opacity protein-like surface antigen
MGLRRTWSAPMNTPRLTLAAAAFALGLAGSAQAQDAKFSISVGAKAWSTQWTTFGYYSALPGATTADVVTQVPAKDKVVLLPLLSVRYRDLVAAITAYQSTDHDLSDGTRNARSEFDASLGYFVLPGVAVTLGYKKVSQRDLAGQYRYEPAGPVLGLNATAPVGGAFSVYGGLGLGKLKTSSSNDPRDVQFKADYRLTEVGLAYTLGTERVVKALSFTAGYRTQVLSSKEALGSQDGRDLTQGLTLGLIATF